MDSWMPWTIVRNFIRAFSPTLVVVIIWDMWRNLSHSPSVTWLAVMIDAVALGVIIAIRLAPPLTGLREQLKGYLHWKWEALIAGSIIVALLVSHKLPHFVPRNVLLGLAGCAFYADLARTCGIDHETSQKTIRAVCVAYGIVRGFVSDTASSIAQIREGTFPWRDAMYFMVLVIVLLAILGFKWWGEGHEPLPEIQELGLNRQNES